MYQIYFVLLYFTPKQFNWIGDIQGLLMIYLAEENIVKPFIYFLFWLMYTLGPLFRQG